MFTGNICIWIFAQKIKVRMCDISSIFNEKKEKKNREKMKKKKKSKNNCKNNLQKNFTNWLKKSLKLFKLNARAMVRSFRN